MPHGFRPVAVVPTYDNPRTIRAVVEALRRYLSEVIVVDDGSAAEGREAIQALGAEGLVRAVRLETNRGKGGAVQAGFAAARSLGFSHVLQVDADGQHDLADVPVFLDAARSQPDALVLGAPTFDKTAPWGRLAGRQLTVFWTHVEIGGSAIADPMCGFRVYPLAAVEGLRCGLRMDFDIEIAVKLVWRGTPVVNLPTKVRYVTAAEGGVSHFRLFEDNLRITLLHFRLVTLAIVRLFSWPFRRWRR